MTATKEEEEEEKITVASTSYKFRSTLSILYIAIRVSTANLSPITDCDEVFNYWEPLHFILYGT
jgi:alpha-1,2-mannosyltransferase